MVKTTHLRNKIGFFDIVNLLFLTVIGIITLYPLLNLFFISISSMAEVSKSGSFMVYPKSINLDGYRYVLKYVGLGDAFKNTVFITVFGTFINLILTAIGAYVLSEKGMPGRNILMGMVLVTMFFGGGLIPTYLVVKSLHMVNTLWSLMLPSAVSTFYLILARNFFQTVPASLKESARIDGASELIILYKIMIPLSMPILATLALFYGVGHWNEYTAAVIYISNSKLEPLQLVIRNMYNISTVNVDPNSLPPPVETVRCAAVVLATVPIICIYPFLQKYFVKGIMVGSVKG
jgi:putative aldouronate transport system permease protein